MGFFWYNCRHCGLEITGSFGDNVYCKNCNLTFETECDLDHSEEGGESHYAWLTGKEHIGKVDIQEDEN